MADKRVEGAVEGVKKAWEKPELKDLGSLTELTHGPAGGAIDGLFGGIGGFQS